MKATFIASGAAALSVACVASADVTFSFTNQTWAGFSFTDLNAAFGGFTGTLTRVSVNATLNASAGFAYADDLTIYVDPLPIGTGGLLQVGGFNSLGATQRLLWANGASSAPGTTVIDSQAVNPITFTGATGVGSLNIWLGNGYGGTGSSGTWTGSITLVGINAIPAPGALALLGAAGIVGRRRRAR